MATTAIPSKADQAKSLTLRDAADLIDDVRVDASYLAALLYLLAGEESFDHEQANALRAAARLAEALAERGGLHSDKMIAAYRESVGLNVAEFAAPG